MHLKERLDRDGRPTSRDSDKGAGWGGPGNRPDATHPEPGTYVELLRRRHDPPAKPFSWISIDAFRKASNDFWSARIKSGIIDEERARRVSSQRRAGIEQLYPDFVVDRTDLQDPSFLVLGDTGEGDESQYAVVAPMLTVGSGTDFMVICSDVIYPAGDVNEYVDKFYVPYFDYPQVIYALPGNHDWFDLLDGFMFNFCGAEPLSSPVFRPTSYTLKERIARAMWRLSSRPNRPLLTALRNSRPPWNRGAPHPAQPGPYFAIDTGPVRLVCIDIGVKHSTDREQAEWLMRVSAGPKPKIMLSGKPIYVDYRYQPGTIDWGDGDLLGRWGEEPPAGRPKSIDDVVRAPEHNYVAHVAGDIHNYQRYPVQVGDREIQYVVSGGGGAFMHATHGIDPRKPPTVPDGVEFPAEDTIKLYPLRGDSLALYTSLMVPWLRSVMLVLFALLAFGSLLGGFLLEVATGLAPAPQVVARVIAVLAFTFAAMVLACLAHLVHLNAHRALLARGDLAKGIVPADVASKFLAGRYGVEAERPGAQVASVDARTARVLDLVLPLKTKGSPIYALLSELFDTNSPPFFKSFLRTTTSGEKLVVECFGVTGWRDDEQDPPREDSFELDLCPRG